MRLSQRRAPTAISLLEKDREAALRDLDPLTVTKLWDNPCWLSFRLNYLGNNFNVPVYGLIEERFGLMRPEFVVLYSLFLKDGMAAKNVVISSGFPKNTISRAIQRLLKRRLVRRELDMVDRRSFVLTLTSAGRAIVTECLAPMIERETTMLGALTETEARQLCQLMDKLVIASASWPAEITTKGREP